MRFLILFSIFISVNILAYSQDRQNAEIPNFIETSQQIISATGWMYDDVSGKWVSNKNLIKGNEVEAQNFNNFYFKTIILNGKKFYALIVKKKSYYYDYPRILKGFHSFTQHASYLFTEDEYKKLINLEGEVQLISTHAIKYNPNAEDEKDPIKFLKNWIVYESKNGGGDNSFYLFKIKKTTSNGKNVYRFLLPYPSNDSEAYFKHNLNDNYFEVSTIDPLLNFNKK